MNEEIKVLMVGGRRCGKTSVLASIFQQMTHDDLLSNYLTISDATVAEEKGGERKEGLNDKINELKQMLRQKRQDNSSVFLVDKKPTNTYWDYKLRISLPKKEESICINFRDSAGEYFEKSSTNSSTTEAYMRECDIFVVVVDTPYLMEANDEVCDNVNRIDDITNFIKNNVNTADGKDAKMVIYVPIKCEKWYNENHIDAVNEKIKMAYSSQIEYLKGQKHMIVGIIPMLTIGNIEFVELKEAFVHIDGHTGKETRCCKVGSKNVRMEDGTLVPLGEMDVVNEDAHAVVNNIRRPYSWYRVKNDHFDPVNCDQLPLRIISFVLIKYKKLKEENVTWIERFFDRNTLLKLLFEKYNNYLGRINPDELSEAVAALKKDNIWKNRGVDGIFFY